MSKQRIGFIAISGMVLLTIVVIFSFQDATVKEPGDKFSVNESKFKGVEIPDFLNFAGESVPLQFFDIRESLERELLVNSYFHSQTIRFIKLAPRYFSIIEPILKEKGVPEDFKYLSVAEGNLDPKSVSPAGAVGMWQFLKVTALEYGLEVNNEVDERYNIEKSTYAACDYLKSAYFKFGSWTLVAASYNSGRVNTIRQTERQKTKNYFDLLLGEETERYVFRILALKMVLEHPEKYGFDIPDEKKYPIIPTKNVEVKGSIASLPDFAIAHGTNYKILKMFNPWLRETLLTNKTGKTYIIKIPEENSRIIKDLNQD
jgi:membrane-bound lytic murein transglycosylase D